MNNRLVCVCNMVTESEIIQKLKKGAKNTCDIQLATKAGTSYQLWQMPSDHR